MYDKYNFLAQLPGLVIAKNTHSTYLNITQDFARLLGWKSALECQGKTDYEIPSKAAEFADEFVKMDKQVIDTNAPMLALDIQNYADGWKLVLVQRNPVYIEEEKLIGLLNYCFDVSDAPIFKAYCKLHQLDNKLFNKSYKPVSYVLSDTHCPFQLTEKQENCLFLLIRGKSIKEIAKVFGVSPRTIESHIDALKSKLNCQYISDLIEKAIDSDFLYYIPKYLQKNKLEDIV